MNLSLYEPPVPYVNERVIYPPICPSVPEMTHHTSERLELRDYVSMKDQPVMHAEDCIAVGCPENLW